MLSHGTIIGTGSKIVAMRSCGHRSGDTAPVREAAAYLGIWGNRAALNIGQVSTPGPTPDIQTAPPKKKKRYMQDGIR
jgi:hypothetical protein